MELSQLLGGGVPDLLDFEALERGGRELALRTLARMVETWLNADRSDHDAPAKPCACGGGARYAGRRRKRFTTVLGAMTLERAYYHCPDCGGGFCPRDRALGLDGTSLSPGATRMTGFAAAETSFGRSSELLRVLAGLRLGAKQVERVAEALGAEVARDERERIDPAPPAADTLYLGLDGTGMPVRPSEREGRAGKQPDGSAKTREVKLVLGWPERPPSPKGSNRHEPGSVRYSGAVESAACPDTDAALSPFAQRVEREAARSGFDQARRQVVLGDGAAWIWNLVSELFPHAIQIVDLFHAKERLWRVAHDAYRGANELAAAWAHAQCPELEAGRIGAVLAALRRLSGEEAKAALGYFQNNRDRMRYGHFRRQDLCVSSGVVESGCKQVVGHRLKRGGMHWTVDGGNAIIALRSCILSDRFEEFWARRASNAAHLVEVYTTDAQSPEILDKTKKCA